MDELVQQREAAAARKVDDQNSGQVQSASLLDKKTYQARKESFEKELM